MIDTIYQTLSNDYGLTHIEIVLLVGGAYALVVAFIMGLVTFFLSIGEKDE
jgi:hypothetical protein